jgi:hypothetical protein
MLRISPKNKHFFFGYYDKNPKNKNLDKTLAHEVNFMIREPNLNDKAKIGYIKKENNQYFQLSETNSWNFQQGSMLQWVDNENIIFNDCNNKKYFAQILNINNKKINERTKFPIYSISEDKKIYSTIDFSKLNNVRKGYGYNQLQFKKNDQILKICKIINSDIIVDIREKDLKDFILPNYKNYWIDHVLFSGYDFVFLLRHSNNDGDLYTKLMYFNFNKKKIYQVLDTGMAGHGSWLNNDEFIIWAREREVVKKIKSNLLFKKYIKKYFNIFNKFFINEIIRKNIYGDKFLIFNKKKMKVYEFKNNIPYHLSGGHFTFFKNKNFMISDTYPDKNNNSILFKYNLKTKENLILKTINTLPQIKDTNFRCDLHPRIVNDEEIIIDSTHEGFRGIYKIYI